MIEGYPVTSASSDKRYVETLEESVVEISYKFPFLTKITSAAVLVSYWYR